MSILPQGFGRTAKQLASQALDRLLPSSCMLCGATSGMAVLCAPCCADLPALPANRCPRCAKPTAQGEHCGRCLAEPPYFDRTVALYRYGFPLDRLIHALKYGHQLPVAAWCGHQVAENLRGLDFECILAMPLHSARLKERGFNQSTEIARPIARRLGLELRSNTLHRTRPTIPQAQLPVRERPGNVRGAFECRADLSGKSVLLVDDVMTTGATLDECARTLKLHGAAAVTVAVVARTLLD